uniref:Photosystem I assembly protein Ycf4 n=1 Tax=Cryptomonas curvata TaxID=233186 RepID=A0A222AHB8_9CRYP|nr:photosystem I assembly protein Ycf4 [Cryptomonas curvata]ASO75765.1 photosystem I assembly protein Ycf4 [Cryptomonas curvata]
MTIQTTLVRHDLILGSRRFSNYFWLIISFLGGIGFFSIGVASYFRSQILPFGNIDSIQFIPQGIVMTFYGVIGILLGLFLLVNITFNVGGGYNKFDRNTGSIEIFRLGFPAQNREIYLAYSFKEIRSIKLRIQEGLNPRREIYLCTKDQREIPLTRVGEPLLLSSIEEEAVDLSLFLNVPLED